MKSQTKKSHKSLIVNGFTLIELLITISIIAILAAMLLPALNKARESAINIKCMSSFKQLSLTAGMYYDDFDAFANEDPSAWWQQRYVLYQKGIMPSDKWKRNAYFLKSNLSCPKFKQDQGNPDGWKYRALAYNGNLGKPYGWSFGKWKYNRDRVALVKPELWYLYVEANVNNAPTVYSSTWFTSGESRHSGGSNVMFMDGHVTHCNGALGAVPRKEGWDPY